MVNRKVLSISILLFLTHACCPSDVAFHAATDEFNKTSQRRSHSASTHDRKPTNPGHKKTFSASDNKTVAKAQLSFQTTLPSDFEELSNPPSTTSLYNGENGHSGFLWIKSNARFHPTYCHENSGQDYEHYKQKVTESSKELATRGASAATSIAAAQAGGLNISKAPLVINALERTAEMLLPAKNLFQSGIGIGMHYAQQIMYAQQLRHFNQQESNSDNNDDGGEVMTKP